MIFSDSSSVGCGKVVSSNNGVSSSKTYYYYLVCIWSTPYKNGNALASTKTGCGTGYIASTVYTHLCVPTTTRFVRQFTTVAIPPNVKITTTRLLEDEEYEVEYEKGFLE